MEPPAGPTARFNSEVAKSPALVSMVVPLSPYYVHVNPRLTTRGGHASVRFNTFFSPLRNCLTMNGGLLPVSITPCVIGRSMMTLQSSPRLDLLLSLPERRKLATDNGALHVEH